MWRRALLKLDKAAREAEFNGLRTQLLVKYAEAENLRKAREAARKAAETEQMRKFAKRIAGVADELLEIATKWKNETQEAEKAVSDGIVMTANAFKQTLSKNDLERQEMEADNETEMSKARWIFKGEALHK